MGKLDLAKKNFQKKIVYLYYYITTIGLYIPKIAIYFLVIAI
ncbi:Uncharacterised protein [uncultured archaeon]|nr:Uncharacterised protein [uncultured archaeon]